MSVFNPAEEVHIDISAERCNRCGRCIATCPRCLLVRDGDRIEAVEDLSSRCIVCGHCVAVCEREALQNSAVPLDACPEVGRLELTDEQLERFLRRRRSVRHFKQIPVEPMKLDRLLDIARYAPTGKNMQGVHYTIVTGERIRQLEVATSAFYRQLCGRLGRPVGRLLVRFFAGAKGLNGLLLGLPDMRRDVERVDKGEPVYCHGAPVVVLVHGEKLYPTMPEDCCFAAYHLILGAETLGLGTCLIGYITSAAGRSREIGEAVKLPRGHHIYSTVAVGYSAERFVRLTPRNTAKVRRLS
jgi:nitroreductase/NAD-dependent dihydropyrimidine dehydrogenase PreA subunit